MKFVSIDKYSQKRFPYMAAPRNEYYGRAVAEAVSRWLPTAAARFSRPSSLWGLWWTKRHWGRFSPSTTVSPANHPPISPS
jgi:hypothetical protein